MDQENAGQRGKFRRHIFPVNETSTDALQNRLAFIGIAQAAATDAALVVRQRKGVDAAPGTDADAAVSYTEDMTVDEIRARMTVEQAKALTVSFGPNKGWTLGQVLDRRPSSLKFYALVSTDASNAIKAGSFLLLDELAQARAG